MAGSLTRDSTDFFSHGAEGEAAVMVCVPLYDYERYVLGTLDSVYHQSLSPLA